MLTKRAQDYLRTLARRPAIPASEVERILKGAGSPCFDPWLAFHESYAGYVEPLGRDTAVWGLVHEQGHWIAPGGASVEKEPHDKAWYIVCADVHPSYSYKLDHLGEFLGEPAVSFDVKVERNALVVDFMSRGKTRYLIQELKDPTRIKELLEGSAIDPHTADKFARYHVSTRYLLKEDAESGGFVYGWARQ